MVIYIFCLIFCQAYSQLCGPGMFPGPLPYEPGPFGPILGPLSQQGPCQPQLCNLPYNPGPIPCGQPPLINVPSCPSAVNQPAFQPGSINPFNQPLPCLPPCGTLPPPCGTPCGTLPPLAIDCQPEPNPVVTTTVVDNTLANTLANAIQLLILSNLLESSCTTPCKSFAPVYEVPVCPCNNIMDITPDYYPCNQIVCCEPPIYEISPCIETCYQEPIVTYTPCVEVTPCAQVANFVPIDACYNPCGSVAFDSCGFNAIGNLGCFDNVNSYVNNCGCRGTVNPCGFGLDNIFSPVAAEVVFPAEIPAQMVCNFGYMPANVPCVSVNVEPLPFDCNCNGVFY